MLQQLTVTVVLLSLKTDSKRLDLPKPRHKTVFMWAILSPCARSKTPLRPRIQGVRFVDLSTQDPIHIHSLVCVPLCLETESSTGMSRA